MKNVSPENIEEMGLVALRNGLLKIRALCKNDPRSVYDLADALHNLPQALLHKNYAEVRQILLDAQGESVASAS